MQKILKVIWVGLLAGFLSEGFLGVSFSLPFIRSILYNPQIQSQLFIDITPLRNIPFSVIGLIVLSIAHSWLFTILSSSIPGKTWQLKGLFWGFTIWLMYWVFQEWFIYHTLLAEPILLNILELTILLLGSCIEGLIISYFISRPLPRIQNNK